MRTMCARLLAEFRLQTLTPDGEHAVAQFRDIVIQDGSSFAVNRTLRDVFPGRFTTIEPAAVEIHATYSGYSDEVIGLLGVQYGYDAQGRMTTIGQGTRQATVGYDGRNRPVSFRDALQRSVAFGYDEADRITSQTLPDGRVIGFAYDANGNVVQVVPPGRPAHAFSYTSVDLTRVYAPPALPGTGATTYTYNRDRQLTRVDRSGGDAVTLAYDGSARLGTVTFDAGSIGFGYHPSGQIHSITAPAETLSYTFDGPLPLTSAWTGAVAGVVGYGYTNDFTVASESVNGTAVTFGYDDDGLLTQAGELTLTRHATHGLLTGTTLRAVTDQYEWTGYAEPARYQAAHPSFGEYPLFDAQYTRNDAGRLTQVIETVDTIQRVWSYTYDDSGRLTVVRRNGDVAAAYTYDANGNRVTYDGDRGHEEGTYDDQDRLLTYGNATFTYAPNGELLTKTVGSQVTHYAYDALGNLRSVTLADGTLIEYVIDGRSRRVGKKVNGTLIQGWLYADQLRIVAELDGAGAVVSRFVYGSKGNVPDYFVRDGVTYRIVSDHLGSPRVILNAQTGDVVQRLDYEAFGVVRQDSNPGFQPFGFAGGLYDGDTGLVRFGARDYDALAGRWTAKDPIGFAGGAADLYGYVLGDPLQFVDPDGADWISAVGNALTGMGDALLFGLGDELRSGVDSLTGWNLSGAVDRCSTSYRTASIATSVASLAAGSGRLAYAAGAKTIAATAKTAEAAVQSRNALKVAFRLGLDRTSRVYSTASMIEKYGSEEKVIAAAGRTNAGFNAAGAAAVAGAINSLLNIPRCDCR
jgi:RHS repeat-associated protein